MFLLHWTTVSVFAKVTCTCVFFMYYHCLYMSYRPNERIKSLYPAYNMICIRLYVYIYIYTDKWHQCLLLIFLNICYSYHFVFQYYLPFKKEKLVCNTHRHKNGCINRRIVISWWQISWSDYYFVAWLNVFSMCIRNSYNTCRSNVKSECGMWWFQYLKIKCT